HVGCLLTEDGAQQLLFRRELSLALGRDLADQDIAGLDLGANVDDARLGELGQSRLADVGDIGRDLLRAQLGIAGNAGQLLDVIEVNRSSSTTRSEMRIESSKL